MKYLLKGFLALFIMSCTQRPVHSGKQRANLSSSKNIEALEPKPFTDTIQSFTNKIYQQYIPSSVQRLLKEKLPLWKLPSPNVWERFWFNQYKKESTLINYVVADFNGDRKLDYAFILESNKKGFAVWILQSNFKAYQTIKLYEFKEMLPLEIGIELVPIGKLNYIDFNADDTKSLNLTNQAIQILYFEKGGETFYWKRDSYASVTTGD